MYKKNLSKTVSFVRMDNYQGITATLEIYNGKFSKLTIKNPKTTIEDGRKLVITTQSDIIELRELISEISLLLEMEINK